MLPKVSGAGITLKENPKTQNIASKLITEDYLRLMMSKSQNFNYKPWKNMYSPKNPHSPFGDFPKDYLSKTTLSSPKQAPVHEISHAGTTLSTTFIFILF